MSAGPRIVFTRFPTGDSPKLVPWLAHLRRVSLGAAPAPASTAGFFDDGVVVWHLMSANNRQLARGASVHDTFQRASDDARDVIASRDELTVHRVSEPARGSYGWVALRGDEPAITCGRWYETERERSHSIALALRSLEVATFVDGARQMHPSLMTDPASATP